MVSNSDYTPHPIIKFLIILHLYFIFAECKFNLAKNIHVAKILITGANGQIGRVLTEALRQKFGRENVLATDITKIEDNEPFEFWTFSTHNVFMK